ncbi:MAG: hypothetical protein HC804_02315 [Anaerolineae bacterium]|nr:hypothetical protein [Anaerolineae bacterium]
MPTIKIYHNPHFLDYTGDHNQIVLPNQPVASVTLPDDTPSPQSLGTAYARTQHGYQYASWFQDPAVIPHLRSTAVGDLIATADGTLHVVENLGFRPYQPQAITPIHKLTEAYHLLETACMGLLAADESSLLLAARQALVAMQQALTADEYPAREMPILWESAQPGDLVGHAEMGQFRVMARKLCPKWRAKRLLAYIPTAQVWIDGSRTWAVLVPVQCIQREPDSWGRPLYQRNCIVVLVNVSRAKRPS